MSTSFVQFRDKKGRGLALLTGTEVRRIKHTATLYEFAQAALAAGASLIDQAHRMGLGDTIDLHAVELLAPIDHPDPAHLLLSGTGLTHLGSAEGRDRMHRAAVEATHKTDSMKMFLMGVEGGKPAEGAPGVQPEWFYKGDGDALIAPGVPLSSPMFALDAGEEPEIAGIYLIAGDGTPIRLGFALANEFSDHITERGNYLWLAHSKLRSAALGPELLSGILPDHVEGSSRIVRNGETIWEKSFVSGEANMSHAIRNVEHHHFKYAGFRRPGDVHVHFFGAATLSFSDDVRTRPGDVFEIEAAPFRLPVRNPIGSAPALDTAVRVL